MQLRKNKRSRESIWIRYLVRSLPLTMKGDDRGENQRFQNWVTLVRLKYKKPCKNLSVLASRRSVLFKSLPNNASLKELYFQACVFGTVKDILITPSEDRPNSSRFFRIEYCRKSYAVGLRSILASSFSLLSLAPALCKNKK